jgi:hypothetical protein
MSVGDRTFDSVGDTDTVYIVQSLQHWKKFYAEHKDYFKVGRVTHPPIDPSSPIPEHCDPKKAKIAQEAERNQRKKAEDRPDEL